MSNVDCNSNWIDEANAVIRDVRHHVQKITISNLPSSNMKIFFNLTTLEKKDFCVELTQEGFRIVGEKYDSEDKKGKYSVYETPYSMLDNLSPAYRDSFGDELLQKLNKLQSERAREREDDDEDENEEENEGAKGTEKKEKEKNLLCDEGGGKEN